MVLQKKDAIASAEVPHAHDALLSPGLARDVRRIRSNRGRHNKVKTEKGNRDEKKDSLLALTNTVIQQSKAEVMRVTLLKRTGKTSTRRTNGIDLPYESTIEALRTYHSIHGDLVIPRRYMVPEDSGYPNEWVGLDLSSSVYNMKWWQKNVKEQTERVSELNKLGFVWERLQPEWNIVLEALVTYHMLYGDVLVPNQFVVPHGDTQWPRAAWNISLGNCVYRIRARNDFLHGSNAASRRNQLQRLGFVWDVYEERFHTFYVVLRHFAKLQGCGKYSTNGRSKPLKVPSTFVVPADDIRWPKELWNYQLGAKCTAVRQKELYVKNKPDRQLMLEQLGFRWRGNADLGWLRVVHAAAIYSKIHHRNLDVPYQFVVPEPPNYFVGGSEEWPWPEHLWGLPLGQRLKDIRITGAYLKGEDAEARRRQLDALGFVWNVREHRFQIFYAALRRYAQIHQCGKFSCENQPRRLNVPSKFVVPKDDKNWAGELWNFRLGSKCTAVRLSGLYVKHSAERLQLLEDLGFPIK